MADATAEAETTGCIQRLEAAADELDRAERAVADEGQAPLEELAGAYESFIDFIDENDGKATGSGREAFEAYVQFQDELVNRLERLPDDLLEREAFEAVGEQLDKRRLSPSDMEQARETLRPAAEKAGLLDDRQAARQRYRRARNAVASRLREVDAAIAEREQLLAWADRDLDADFEPLRSAVEAYNEAVHEAFRSYKREAPARDLLDWLDAARDYPLVDLDPAPEPLASYLRSEPVGTEPVSRLLEFTDYSASKLAHYVDDVNRFRATVGANRTYLDRLDAAPLTVDWPPPPATELRYLARELVAMVDRFAPDETVAALHALRDRTRTADYGRQRQAAIADERLDADQRDRLQSGAVAAELEGLRADREQLQDALDTYPER